LKDFATSLEKVAVQVNQRLTRSLDLVDGRKSELQATPEQLEWLGYNVAKVVMAMKKLVDDVSVDPIAVAKESKIKDMCLYDAFRHVAMGMTPYKERAKALIECGVDPTTEEKRFIRLLINLNV
jgi:hypothetical protein